MESINTKNKPGQTTTRSTTPVATVRTPASNKHEPLAYKIGVSVRGEQSMRVVERIHVVTPVSQVVTALQTLMGEYGYTCRTESIVSGVRLLVGDGRFAVDLVQAGEPKRIAAVHRPTSQQPFRVLGGLEQKSVNAVRRRASTNRRSQAA